VASLPARVDASITTVRRQFQNRAKRHPMHDAIVRETAARMLERLALMRHPVQRMLDLGCGRGACRKGLLERFPDAQWLGLDLSEAMLRAGRPGPGPLARWLRALAPARAARGAGLVACASADRLPLADASQDLVFSNLLLHWHPDPQAVVREMARVLRSGGLILFSNYGPDTLQELRAACGAALPAARPMPFVDMHDLGDMLVDCGFAAPVMEMEALTLTYRGARPLLDEVRALGGNPRADRPRGLPSGRQARALLAALQSRADGQGRIPLRFEIVIGHGWKAPPRQAGVGTIAMPRSRRA
jgi:malonyl-CoA O-methyltransferase